MTHDSTTRRIAIATSLRTPAIHADDRLFVGFLNERGFICEAAPWNEPSVNWQSFDAVLIRSTWDYVQHYAQFLRWLDLLEQLALPVLNPAPLLKWNSNKRYLLELERAGVPIIPTRVALGRELPSHIYEQIGEELVVKPTVSAGAWQTVRGVAGSAEFDAAIAGLPAHIEFLVQPFAPEVMTEGEWSLLFFGGEYSHCVVKRPASGDYRVQNDFGGSSHIVAPPVEILDDARRALDAVELLGHRGSCYARVDGVRRNGRLLIMEVEMIEPSLFFDGDAAASERFARAIAARLESPAAKR